MGTDVRGHFLPKSSVCLEHSSWISCKLVCFIFLNKQTLDSPVSFHLSEHLSWGYWVTVSQKQRIWDFLYKMQTFCKIQNDWNSLKRQVAKGWMFYAPILENVKKKINRKWKGVVCYVRIVYWKVSASMFINIFQTRFFCFDMVFITQNNFHLGAIFSY